MNKDRLLAFTDGVLAVVITIMVLELKPPEGATLAALTLRWPVFLSYVLSFVYIGIYWVNHHHLFTLVRRVNGAVLWANLHLLFWLSLVPFSTAWVGEHGGDRAPALIYGVSLLGPAVAYYIMQQVVVAHQPEGSGLKAALGRDLKGQASPWLYVAGIAGSAFVVWIGYAFYVAVALIWLIPDPRIERHLAAQGKAN